MKFWSCRAEIFQKQNQTLKVSLQRTLYNGQNMLDPCLPIVVRVVYLIKPDGQGYESKI